jgi:curved DNA-binding protein CbpA
VGLIECRRQSERDCYELLGVGPDASAEEIRRAYHRLAFQCHPDRSGGGDEANREMQELNEAYAILSDPIRRRDYDLPRGYGSRVPKFKKGSKVKISLNYPSPYMGHTGVVDKEPIKDTFRFWYMVRVESRGLTTLTRFAEEELEKLDDQHLARPASVRNEQISRM